MIKFDEAETSENERRVAPRIRTLKRARVLFNNRFSTIDCVVRNVSATGALLTVDTAVQLPRIFEIRIGEETEIRPAKLVYRREMLAGIHFLDVEEDNDGALMKVEPDARDLAFADGEIERIQSKPLPSAVMNALPWMTIKR